MLEIVQMPLARRIWNLSKMFHLPISDQRMQDLNPFDMEFYELSVIADDPKKLEQLKNHYYDPEFDEWLEEFDNEQEELKSQQGKHVETDDKGLPDADTIEWSNKNREQKIYEEDYEESLPVDSVSDWEEVD